MKHFFHSLFILLILSCEFSGCKAKKTPSTVNIAIQPSAAFIPLYVARYNGFIEDALKPLGVTVNWQDFESGPPMNESLSAEMSDIGVIGDVPSVSALAGAVPMKIVGIPASGSDAYAMLSRRDDNGFKDSSEMKGKRIATVFGSTGHNFVTKLLQKNGLTFDDVEFVSINAGDAENVLNSKLADAVVIWEPNVTRLIDSGVAKVVAYGSETDLRGTNAFVVRSEYLLNHREVIKVILEQYERSVTMIPELDGEILSKIASALKITPEQVKEVAKKYDFSVRISADDVKSLQDTVRFLVQIGNLDAPYLVSSKTENIL